MTPATRRPHPAATNSGAMATTEPHPFRTSSEDDGTEVDRMSRPNALLVIVSLSGCLWLLIAVGFGGI